MLSVCTSRMDKENLNGSLSSQRGFDQTSRQALAQVCLPFPNSNVHKSDGPQILKHSKVPYENIFRDVSGSHVFGASNTNSDLENRKKRSSTDTYSQIKSKLEYQCSDVSQKSNYNSGQSALNHGVPLSDSFAGTRGWNSSYSKDCNDVTAVQLLNNKCAPDDQVANSGLSAQLNHVNKSSSTTAFVGGCDGVQGSGKSLRSYHSTPDCKTAFQDHNQLGQASNVRQRRKRVSGVPMRVPVNTLTKYREEEEEESNSWLSREFTPLSPGVQATKTDGSQESSAKQHAEFEARQNKVVEPLTFQENVIASRIPSSDFAVDGIQSNTVSPPNLQHQATLQKDGNSQSSQPLDNGHKLEYAFLNPPVRTPLLKPNGTLGIDVSAMQPMHTPNIVKSSHLPDQAAGYMVVNSQYSLPPDNGIRELGHALLDHPMQTPMPVHPVLTPLPGLVQPQIGYPFTPITSSRPNCNNPYSQMAPPQTTSNIITVNGRPYTVLSLLGKGGSSKVYQVYEMEKKLLLAIKCVKLEDADESTSMAYKNEITLLQKLQHSDRVIKLYDHEYNEGKECLYAVIEKGDTDLASLIRNYAKKGQITAEMIKFYWSEMLRAVAVIHKAGIVHSDLKPANFLLVSGKLKLIDFGIARSIQTDMTSVFKDTQEGTFNYMSPEAIQDTAQVPEVDEKGRRRPRIKINVKADVWSLGCILYNLVYGRTPFQHIPQPVAKMQAITNPNHAISFPVIADKLLVDVMQKCLVRDLKQRPSIEELLCHPYLSCGVTEAPNEPNEEHLVGTILKQLASLTPRSLTRISQELSKMLRPTQTSSSPSSSGRNEASC